MLCLRVVRLQLRIAVYPRLFSIWPVLDHWDWCIWSCGLLLAVEGDTRDGKEAKLLSAAARIEDARNAQTTNHVSNGMGAEVCIRRSRTLYSNYMYNHQLQPYSTLMLIILISSTGFSLKTLAFSIICTTSIPFTHLPKIVCLSSNHGALSVVMKN